MDQQRGFSWLLLYILGGVVVVASAAFPWWMDEGAFSLATLWARTVVLVGVLALILGVLAFRGWLPRGLLLIGPILLFASLVAFYDRVVKSEFSDWEFTRFIEIGFFVALLGLGCIAIGALAAATRAPSPWWAPAVAMVVVAVAVLALDSWTRDNAIEIMGLSEGHARLDSALSSLRLWAA